MHTNTKLVPLLVCRGAGDAIDFYVRALDADVIARYEHGPERRVSHADLRLGDGAFAVTEEARTWNSDAPPSLGGSPVVMQLHVDDAEGVLSSMRNAGATVVFPIQDLLGERMARVRDPFGHLWLVRQVLVELSREEIQMRRDDLFAKLEPKLSSLRYSRSAGGKDNSNLSDTPTALQDPIDERESTTPGSRLHNPKIHLVIGPVGAGKSTFALGLVRDNRALRLTLDEWMAGLFSPDRPDAGVVEWYVERASRCVERIWSIAEGVIASGTDAVLEIGLLKRRERESFYKRVDDANIPLLIYVVDAPRDVRRERVEARNRVQGATFSMIVPLDVFELASDLWESPDPSECADRDVRFIDTNLA